MTPATPRKILLVGDRGGTNIGACFERAALAAGLEVRLMEARAAMEAPVWVRRFNWHVRGHRPTHLERFSGQVLACCRDWRPSVLLATGGAPLTAQTLAGARAAGTLTANYSTDDPWNPSQHARWFICALPEYSAIFTARRANLEDFRSVGCRSVHYLPFGYDSTLHFVEQPESGDLDCDVLFIGGADKDREPYCDAIVRAGLRLALYGDYWSRFARLRASFRGYADLATLRTATAAARVCLCLARRANRDGHTMRTFEAAAMGGCLLVEDTPEHRDIFGEAGQAAVYFASIPEMIDRAKWLLDHPPDRQRLAEAAHRRITAGGNTYADRLDSLLATLTAAHDP